MNAQKKTILTIIVGILLIGLLLGVVYAKSNLWSDTDKLRENCSTGSVDACNEYIKIQQSEYNEIKTKLDDYSTEANKAREVIKEQLSWTFI